MTSNKVSREAVIWAYRLFLGREAESEAAINGHLANSAELESLTRAFAESAEFSALKGGGLNLTLDGNEPKRLVETTGDPQLLGQLFDHVNSSWQYLGEIDPYWSVLSLPEYHGTPPEEAVTRFFASGKADVARLVAALKRENFQLDGRGTCIEYGCGLGRLTRHLAPHFSHMIGVDISSAHLRLADELAGKSGIRGIEWRHLKSLGDIEALPETDFIYSLIVLQHNPPPVIERILRAFARILRPGGIAYFQVPTYRQDYEFQLADYMLQQLGKKEMEMHAFPQARIFQIFAEQGVVPISVVEDGCTGLRLGERSNTFLFKKERT